MSSVDVPHLLTDAQLHRVFQLAYQEVNDDAREMNAVDARDNLAHQCQVDGLPNIDREVIELAVRAAARSFLEGASGVFDQAGVPNPLEEEETE